MSVTLTQEDINAVAQQVLTLIRESGREFNYTPISFTDPFNVTSEERENIKVPAIDERIAGQVKTGSLDLEALLQAYGLTEVQQIASEVSTNYMPRTEVQTALDGKAPAGYGLGTNAIYLSSSSDLNNLLVNGFYRYASNSVPANGVTVSSPFCELYTLTVSGSSTGSVVQTITAYGTRHYQLQRTLLFSTWGDWEWVNPPMSDNVEYRTTERWNGKPVYTKRISLGALGGAESVVSATFSSTAVTEVAVDHGWCGSLSLPSHNVSVYANLTTVFAYNISNAGLAGAEVIVTLKYTKD